MDVYVIWRRADGFVAASKSSSLDRWLGGVSRAKFTVLATLPANRDDDCLWPPAREAVVAARLANYRLAVYLRED